MDAMAKYPDGRVAVLSYRMTTPVGGPSPVWKADELRREKRNRKKWFRASGWLVAG